MKNIDFFFPLIYNKKKIKGGVKMLKYKIDVIKELSNIGINSNVARTSGIFGQSTMAKFKNGDTSITLDNLNRLCCVLEMQPRDVLKFVETDKDREEIIAKIPNKKV